MTNQLKEFEFTKRSLEIQIDTLMKWSEQAYEALANQEDASMRLDSLIYFKQPFEICPEMLEIDNDYDETSDFSKDLIQFIVVHIITAFQQEDSLLDISAYLVLQLRERQIENKEKHTWLVCIRPVPVDLGIAFDCQTTLKLYFSRDDINYEIVVSRLL